MNYELDDEFYSIISLKTALWQYMIDHAEPIEDGVKFHIIVRDEQDFWKRVSARENGTYKRKDIKDFYEKSEKRRRECAMLRSIHRRSNKREQKINFLASKGTFPKRQLANLVILLRKFNSKIIRNYLTV